MNVSVLSPFPAHNHPDFAEPPRFSAAMRELAGPDLLPADGATADYQGLFALWSGRMVADLPGLGETMPVGLAKRKRADDDDIGEDDDELEDDDDDVEDDDDDDDDFDDDDDVEEGFDDEDLDDDDEIFYDEDEEE